MQGCSEPIASQMNQQSSFLIFLGGKLRNLAPLGAHGFFVAWPQKLIVFSCVSMPVLSSILAAAAKSPLRDKGSQKSPAGGGGGSHLVWFSSGQNSPVAWKQLLQHIVCAYTVWEKSLGCWEGGMAHLLLLSPFSGPSMGSSARRSNPWVILGKSGAGGVPTVGGHVAWGGQLALAAQPSMSVLHLQPWPSHTCLDVGLGALHQRGSEANLRRGLSGEGHPWWDICFSEARLDLRLPFPGCGVGTAVALPGAASSVFRYTFNTDSFHSCS